LCGSHVFEDEDVRKQVAWALREIGDARVVEPIPLSPFPYKGRGNIGKRGAKPLSKLSP